MCLTPFHYTSNTVVNILCQNNFLSISFQLVNQSAYFLIKNFIGPNQNHIRSMLLQGISFSLTQYVCYTGWNDDLKQHSNLSQRRKNFFDSLSEFHGNWILNASISYTMFLAIGCSIQCAFQYLNV